MIRPVGGFGRQRAGRSFAAGGSLPANFKMPRGRFDRLVTILAPPQSAPDDWHEESGAPPIETEAWAAVKTAPGTERFASGENAALAPMRFFFRWREDLVRPDFAIRHAGKTFDVKSVEELGRRELLQVIAVARALG